MVRSCCLLLLLALCSSVLAQTGNGLPVLPKPVSAQRLSGHFILRPNTIILAASTGSPAARFLQQYLEREWKFQNPVTAKASGAGPRIEFVSNGAGLPPEGYHLEVAPGKITLTGSPAGLFYAVQSLIQLLPVEKGITARVPACKVEDYPRFGYRGMHLDVSRNFFSVETVKQYIDLMAAYKLNQLHWHLTDDQGWRIEIKKYPKLTTVGSRRDRTVLGHYWDRLPQWFDTADHAGFYTQAQIRDIVRYAAERHINIIPEIEMPGHSSAAIAAYPELSCVPGEPKKVAETWGIFTDIYCPSETTFRFLEDVLAEVMELFPSPYIHIGGDEAPKDKWEASPLAQALIRERGLKDAHGLQSYFISRIEQFVNSKGRKLIGWDEILEGGLAPNAAVTSWRGEQGGIDAARLGHEVVMNSQLNGLYFSDRPEPRTELEFRMNRHSLQALYQYDPVPSVLTPEQRKYIIGAQGAIWTEYVRTPARLQYTLLPRMLALSELLWTPAAGRNFHTFAAERLPLALARLEKGGIQFRVPPALGPVDTLLQGGQFLLTFAPSVAGAVIHYTTDGYPATETDRVYTAPLVITVPEGEQREIQTVVVTPGNRKSAVTRTVLYNRPAPEATRYGVLNGLNYRLSRGSFSALSELDTARVWTSDTATSWDMEALRRQHGRFGITYSGFIRLDTDGAYTFSLQSDGPSELLVDGRVVAVHTGGGAAPSTGTVTTLRGLHALRIRYRNTGQPNQLQITLRLPDGRSLPLPHWMLLGQNIGAGMTGVDYQ